MGDSLKTVIPNSDYKIRDPNSAFPSLFILIISFREKTIKKRYPDQRGHNEDIGDGFRMQHVFLQGVYGVFH
jgi:hypothetical protein